MEDKEIDLYLLGRKKEAHKSKLYIGTFIIIAVFVLLDLVGLEYDTHSYIYVLAFVVVLCTFLDAAPWVRPKTRDLLDIIENQINKDPELIDKVAKRNT